MRVRGSGLTAHVEIASSSRSPGRIGAAGPGRGPPSARARVGLHAAARALGGGGADLEEDLGHLDQLRGQVYL